jgi:hypothetical protein
MSNNIVDNLFFARFWTFMSAREPEPVWAWRREVLAGVSGRVLEAGFMRNFDVSRDTHASHK